MAAVRTVEHVKDRLVPGRGDTNALHTAHDRRERRTRELIVWSERLEATRGDQDQGTRGGSHCARPGEERNRKVGRTRTGAWTSDLLIRHRSAWKIWHRRGQ